MKKYLPLGLALSLFVALRLILFRGERATHIELRDGQITVDGKEPSRADGVYAAKDIICYEEGRGEDYGEGGVEHSAREAMRHTVVHITKPGTYVLSGSMHSGQIAVDLGRDAESDRRRKVTLILDGVNISCGVAPAIICYSAYECAPKDLEFSTRPDHRFAGFVIKLAERSDNYISGSHVDKIYKPGTKKTLHKYDGAIESEVSFIMEGSGNLTVQADKEGIESKLHLWFNGGNILIHSRDDAVNAREDGISTITVINGDLTFDATHGTEGDGIDSNGGIVIEAGEVTSIANSYSADSGLDSDLGCQIYDGRVVSCGNMYDEISEINGSSDFLCLNFPGKIANGQKLIFLGSNGYEAFFFEAMSEFGVMIISSPGRLGPGEYTLWLEDEEGEKVQLAYTGTSDSYQGGMTGDGILGKPDRENPAQPREEGETPPQNPKPGDSPPQGDRPDKEGLKDSGTNNPVPDQNSPGAKFEDIYASQRTDFNINSGATFFYGVAPVEGSVKF